LKVTSLEKEVGKGCSGLYAGRFTHYLEYIEEKCLPVFEWTWDQWC